MLYRLRDRPNPSYFRTLSNLPIAPQQTRIPLLAPWRFELTDFKANLAARFACPITKILQPNAHSNQLAVCPDRNYVYIWV
jgi:hypothetical protein